MFLSNLYTLQGTQQQQGPKMEKEAVAGIEVIPMIQTLNSEMRDKVEDWTGKSSTEMRRKLQNRLNQRASRKRKMMALAVVTDKVETIFTGSYSTVDHPPESMQPMCLSPVTRSLATSPIAIASILTPLPTDQKLLTLMQFNLIRALAQNVALLGLNMDQMNDDILSPFNFESSRSKLNNLPPELQPTYLQLSIPHHPEMDILPFPEYRDNILREGISIDDYELCIDILYGVNATGVAGSSHSGRTGLIVWDSPWLPSSWEVDEAFARKYKKLFQGCQRLIETSNYWRSYRGEAPLKIEF